MKTIFKTIDGKHGIFLIPSIDNFIYDSMDVYKVWEEQSIDKCKTLLNKESVVVEIGSHVGTHTVPLAKMCSYVFAFEMQRVVYQTLNANLILNGCLNVETFLSAVSNENKIVKFKEVDFLKNEEHKVNTGNMKIEIMSGDNGIHTHVVTLDEKLKDIKQSDLIKIDAEGHELPILQGAKNLIEKHKPYILTEFGDFNLTDIKVFLKNYEFEDLSDFISGTRILNKVLLCKPKEKV